MMSWIESHEAVAGLGLQVVTALIWLFYLQLIAMGMTRQRRPVILIHRSAGMGDEARCFVSNMGAEPTYLVSVMAELTVDGKRRRAFITDRKGSNPDEDEVPNQRTAQGPIDSGGMIDVCSFGDLVERVLHELGDTDAEFRDLRLTALCAAGHSGQIVAAYRDFRVGRKEGVRGFVPVQVSTLQVGSRFRRHALRRTLKAALAEEAEGYGV